MLISERGIYNKNGYIVRNKIEILQKIFVPWDEKRYFKKKMFAPWDMGYGIVPSHAEPCYLSMTQKIILFFHMHVSGEKLIYTESYIKT